MKRQVKRRKRGMGVAGERTREVGRVKLRVRGEGVCVGCARKREKDRELGREGKGREKRTVTRRRNIQGRK